jgi:SPP1 gp7 family putative phage head morphogenesis protein
VPLRFNPPKGDPREWLLAVEEEIARFVTKEITSIATQATEMYFNSLTSSGDYGVFDIIPIRWTDFVNGEIVDTFAGVHANGSVSTWIQSPNTPALPFAYAAEWTAVVNAEAVAYARTMPNRMVGVGDHLWNTLTQKISVGIETGDVRDRLTKTIQEATQFSRIRAEMIARTETTRAYNLGNLAGAQALGEFGPVEKAWATGLDERVRPTHLAAEGQYVPLNGYFSVGDAQMLAPGDGPPQETLNCRCTTLYLYPGDVRPDGSVVPSQGNTGVARSAQVQSIVDSLEETEDFPL